ncbi:MAG: hypothetical protein OEY63_04215, partial [Gemmatimonadota bacterium]|nr:hypothetical protein [Gemmatimonadota bacterium]
VYRYLLGDWLPYIYRTENFGDSWTLLTDGNNGIPVDWPTRVVREDPVVPGLLYAGTEFGIFVSFDDGTLWQSLQLNLPVTPITDLKIHRDDIVMSTMGRAFWILDDVSRLREIAAGIEVDSPHLFSPRDAYRMRYRAGGFGGRSPDEPEYPPPGVILDYYLPSEASGEVTLEIFDSEGNLVRAFSSETGQPEVIRPAEPNMHEFRLERIGGTRLDKSAGAHRFRWDMQYAGAWHEDGRQAGRNGPLAVPGNYSVRLNAGGESKTANFLIRVDPRVSAEGVTIDDLNAQFELQVRVRDALSRARVISSQVSEAMESTGSDTAEGRALASLHARLETAEGRYMVPMLVAQLGYLNGMISRADQRPGRDAYERLETLQRELNSIAEAFEEIR